MGWSRWFSVFAALLLMTEKSAHSQVEHIGASVGGGLSFVRNDSNLTPLLHPTPGFSLNLTAEAASIPGIEGFLGLKQQNFHAESIRASDSTVSLTYLAFGLEYQFAEFYHINPKAGVTLNIPVSSKTPKDLDQETSTYLKNPQVTGGMILGLDYVLNLLSLNSKLSYEFEFLPTHVLKDSRAAIESYWFKWTAYFI